MSSKLERSLVAHSFNSPVRVVGQVESVRLLKKIAFLVIRDRSGNVQVTVLNPELRRHIQELTIGSAIEVIGAAKDNDSVKLHGKEIIPDEIIIHSLAEVVNPLATNPGRAARLDWRFLDLRRPEAAVMFKAQSVILEAMHSFALSEDFFIMQSPKILGTASESGAELFKLDYFGQEACLAQSPQFYKQMGIAAGLERYFEVGPVFRANSTATSRHATEFTSIDMEMAWVESHEDVMQMEEQLIHNALVRVENELGEQVRSSFDVEVVIPTLPFPRIPISEVKEIVEARGVIIPPEKKGDLTPEAEREICAYVMEKYGHEFVFVTDFPVSARPFYHMIDPETGLTKSFDLLWKGVEITTGAQREHRYETLLAQALEKGLEQEEIQFYLDFFSHGCPPHGGFGLGLSRMIMLLVGAPNIREAVYLYRGTERLTP
jgi:aspartyl/asparaginyl-tRNA synthetase